MLSALSRWLRPLALAGALVVSLAAAGVALDGTASAGAFFEDVCKQQGASSSAVCSADGKDKISGPQGLLGRVTNLLALVTGIVAVGMIIYSGFTFITAAGDSGKIEQARKTIIYAVIGLVVIVAARGIILFVISRV